MLEVISAQLGQDGATEADPRLINGVGTVTAFALGWGLMTTRGAESRTTEAWRSPGSVSRFSLHGP